MSDNHILHVTCISQIGGMHQQIGIIRNPGYECTKAEFLALDRANMLPSVLKSIVF